MVRVACQGSGFFFLAALLSSAYPCQVLAALLSCTRLIGYALLALVFSSILYSALQSVNVCVCVCFFYLNFAVTPYTVPQSMTFVTPRCNCHSPGGVSESALKHQAYLAISLSYSIFLLSHS